MKSLLPRTIALHLSPPPPLRAFLILLHSGSVASRLEPYQTSPPLQRRQHEEESRQVRVTVWWDFENCHVPACVNVLRVAQRITAALRSSGIKGPVTINAFGDVAQLSRATQEALTSTGVCLTHVPHSGKNSSDRFFMADLVYWVSQNPPPMHFFLISGDGDFANILHRLRMSNYNILLASNDCASRVLCSAATIMWPWNGLVRGQNVSVKHFNHPPDGLYGSWYGYYKGPLDDPFVEMEQPAKAQPEASMEQISEAKPRQIPKALVNRIRHILRLYPEGINLSELRAELTRNNITVDKDYFGHKKFSQLLSSMPNILKFIHHPSSEGQPLVISADRSVLVEPSSKPSAENETGDRDKVEALPSNGKSSVLPPTTLEPSPTSKETIVETSVGLSTSSPQCQDGIVEEGLFKRIWKALAIPQPTTPGSSFAAKDICGPQPMKPEPPLVSKEMNERAAGGAFTSGVDVVEEGFYKRIWRTLTGPRDDYSSEKIAAFDADSTRSQSSDEEVESMQGKNQPEKVKLEEKTVPSKNDFSPPSATPLRSMDKIKSPPENKSTRQVEDSIDAPDMRIGFFKQIVGWLKFWKSSSKCEDDNSVPVKEVGKSQESKVKEHAKVSAQGQCQPEVHGLFSKSQFWDSLESFLLTEEGSDLILKSRTREQLVHRLQRGGHEILKGLQENHLFQLVNLLILEKRWVEESPSHDFPFKLILPARRTYCHGSKGLSSLFTGRMSQSNLQRSSEQDKRFQNPVPFENAFSGSSDAKPPQNLAELKTWFQTTCNTFENIEPDDFQKLFESKFNRKLVCSTYGYSTLQNLMVAVLTDTGCNQGKIKKPPTREEILSDCHKLLVELLKENPGGFNMSIFRPTFIQRHGYVLDYEMLGYPKLASLLQIMPEVRIESSFILPAKIFNSSSCWEKVSKDESISHSEEDERGKVRSLSSESPSSGEESVWDELGPVSRSDISEDVNIRHEEVGFEEAFLSEGEFTDSEDDAAIQLNVSGRQSKRGEECSSLHQILDSWYSSKDGGEREQVQDVDGLVDCSKDNTEKPLDVKPRVPVKPKLKPYRSYSFVSENQDDKENLVEGILETLKKAGDSRLKT